MTTMTGRGWLATVTAGMVTLLALAGCGLDSDDGGFTERDAGDEQAAGAAPGEDRSAAGGGDQGGVAGGAVVDTRSIVYTGAITVRVADVGEAARAATELADRHGGFVGGDRRSTSGTAADARATLVLRIPSDGFTAAIDALGGLGDEESREIQTEDVTEEVVDLETRIATAQASVERTRALLEQADSIGDIVAVEAELSKREAALASLQARQRRLADLTTLSTITADLLARHAVAVDRGDQAGFLAGLSAGWSAFTRSVTVLLTGLGAMLPWLVALGAPTAAGVWWSRRRRALRAAPAAPVPGPGASEPPGG
jgi:hypothetical protein